MLVVIPMSDYEIDAARKKVVVRIYGNENNKRYTDLLKTNNTLSLWDCISLDAVQMAGLSMRMSQKPS